MGYTINTDFIKEKFLTLLESFHLILMERQTEYEAIFVNEYIKIRMYSSSRENGISTSIVNLNNNKSYYFHQIMEKKKVNTEFEFGELKNSGLLDYGNDQFKVTVTGIFTLLEKYCNDILSGDFSIMSEG